MFTRFGIRCFGNSEMKWREIAVYLYLLQLFNSNEVDRYDLIYALNLFASRKTVRRIIRRLRKLGLLREHNGKYKLLNLKEFIEHMILPYMASRLKRRLRNLDPHANVRVQNSKLVIQCNRACLDYVNRYLKLIPSLHLHIFLQEYEP